jgi:hypothetical protein
MTAAFATGHWPGDFLAARMTGSAGAVNSQARPEADLQRAALVGQRQLLVAPEIHAAGQNRPLANDWFPARGVATTLAPM